jgi:hypothetical protein
MRISIAQVPDEVLDKVWGEVEPILKRAVAATRNRESMISIWGDLITKNRTLWVALADDQIIGAATFKIYKDTDMNRVALIDYVAGKDGMKWLSKMMKVFEKYGQDQGCYYIEAWGVPGWDALGKRCGMTEIQRVYRKTIGED